MSPVDRSSYVTNSAAFTVAGLQEEPPTVKAGFRAGPTPARRRRPRDAIAEVSTLVAVAGVHALRLCRHALVAAVYEIQTVRRAKKKALRGLRGREPDPLFWNRDRNRRLDKLR